MLYYAEHRKELIGEPVFFFSYVSQPPAKVETPRTLFLTALEAQRAPDRPCINNHHVNGAGIELSACQLRPAPAVSEGSQTFAWENRSIRFLGLGPLVNPSHNLISMIDV